MKKIKNYSLLFIRPQVFVVNVYTANIKGKYKMTNKEKIITQNYICTNNIEYSSTMC